MKRLNLNLCNKIYGPNIYLIFVKVKTNYIKAHVVGWFIYEPETVGGFRFDAFNE